VTPPPDFRSLIEGGGAAAEAHVPETKPATTYQTTYYPGTPDRSQATPIQVRAGDEFPVNFSLTPSPSLSIRGKVVNLPARSSASIMLQSRDFRLVMSGAEMHKDGSFVIRDVSPGSYLVLASVEGSAVPMMAQLSGICPEKMGHIGRMGHIKRGSRSLVSGHRCLWHGHHSCGG
jgi:hypothetical protein